MTAIVSKYEDLTSILLQEGKYAPEPNAIMARARKARQWLKNRPEKNIVVVTHGGFLHYFTEDWQDSAMYQGTSFTNLPIAESNLIPMGQICRGLCSICMLRNPEPPCFICFPFQTLLTEEMDSTRLWRPNAKPSY